MGREPEIPDDEPGDPWVPDDATAEIAPIDPDVPDDPPDEPLLPDEAPPPELDLEAPDDADDGSWVPDPEPLADEIPLEPQDPLILGWRETAHLPEHGIDLPAVLDPTAAETTWIIPSPPPVASLPLVVRIATFEVRVQVIVREGRSSELRLGRDALAGRVLVRS